MENISDTIDFGFKTIPLEEKQGRVNSVFDGVASKYDVMNDVLSLRMHRVWKQSLITKMRIPSSNSVFKHLDVAGGTGDIVARALESAGAGYEATLLDINEAMLREAEIRFQQLSSRAKAQSVAIQNKEWIAASAKMPLRNDVSIILGNAEELPFPDSIFDVVTIAFGLRNVPRRAKALSEFMRVLKTGGQFLCLEFAPVELPVLKQIYDAYSLHFMPKLGEWIAGDADSYQYLAESIRKFPMPERLELEMKQAGFAKTKFTQFSGGITALHQGVKI